jgi:UDPglucose--hexose-1-phosphate uridylyltransferase
VIIATERAARPTDFKHEAIEANDLDKCPFCEGREDRTPPEIFALRAPGTAPNTPGWRVRVVSNKFPALRIEGSTERTKVGLFTRMDGIGAHEVIIETTDHHRHLALQPDEHVADVIRAYLQRYRDLRGDARFEYALLFRNHGRIAGASLSHPHSQLIALPVVPKRVADEMDAAELHFGRYGACIYCTMLEQERQMGERLVFENEAFVALEPYASRFPFETWIIPKVHEADFGALRPEHELPLARVLRETLQRLNECLDNPPYNFTIHTIPYRWESTHAHHWYLEIMPRLTQVAGFEWGSGFYINPIVPEVAAKFLRGVGVAPMPVASAVAGRTPERKA